MGSDVSTRTLVIDAAARRAERAGEHQASVTHDSDVCAHLLDFGKQMRGHEHRCATGTHIADDRPHFRVPCGSRPLVGSSSTSNSRGFSNAAARPSRCRIPIEYAR